MDRNQYQKEAITTKIYDDSVAFPYIVLGIVGEVGELLEKVSLSKVSLEDEALTRKEIGDVAWYLAGWCEENGLKLATVIKLKEQDYVGRYSVEDLKLKLVLHGAEIAEFTKKALRDDLSDIQAGKYPKAKLLKANIAVANLWEAIEAIAFYFMYDFDQILADNIEKLQSRKDRGQIKGSGDER